VQSPAPLISRIAFGACGYQDLPQPILDTVILYRPDVFVFWGDTIYGDTKDMRVLSEKYAK
jgi:alkaline phosphatase D